MSVDSVRTKSEEILLAHVLAKNTRFRVWASQNFVTQPSTFRIYAFNMKTQSFDMWGHSVIMAENRSKSKIVSKVVYI